MGDTAALGPTSSHLPTRLTRAQSLPEPTPRLEPADLPPGTRTCSRAWGAISTTTACSGTCHRASWNSTGLTRLLTLYSAEIVRARLPCHWASGMEVLSQRGDRGRGSRITCAHSCWVSARVPGSTARPRQTPLREPQKWPAYLPEGPQQRGGDALHEVGVEGQAASPHLLGEHALLFQLLYELGHGGLVVGAGQVLVLGWDGLRVQSSPQGSGRGLEDQASPPSMYLRSRDGHRVLRIVACGHDARGAALPTLLPG